MNRATGSDTVHLVGSIAMDNCEQVFREISAELGPYLDKIPDGETGERARWIYFQRTMLMEHPAMEIDTTVPETGIVPMGWKTIALFTPVAVQGRDKS